LNETLRSILERQYMMQKFASSHYFTRTLGCFDYYLINERVEC
jgi:hypothetical protein